MQMLQIIEKFDLEFLLQSFSFFFNQSSASRKIVRKFRIKHSASIINSMFDTAFDIFCVNPWYLPPSLGMHQSPRQLTKNIIYD